jgi:hypothetical protein
VSNWVVAAGKTPDQVQGIGVGMVTFCAQALHYRIVDRIRYGP